MELVKKRLDDIVPYANNPRKNDQAVEAVAESIKQCDYIAPIVVDEDGVILAGHTRYKALLSLGYTEAECVVKAGLTDEQKRKYRLLDNKTNELAEWDLELLAGELDGLDFGELDLNWDMDLDEEVEKERSGDFSESDFVYKQQYGVTVILGNEGEQEACYRKLTEMGYNCRVVTV